MSKPRKSKPRKSKDREPDVVIGISYIRQSLEVLVCCPTCGESVSLTHEPGEACLLAEGASEGSGFGTRR